MPLDPRKTVFVGGVPRPLKAGMNKSFIYYHLRVYTVMFANHVWFNQIAVELAMIMDRLYGGVCYAGIDTDPELRYPVLIRHWRKFD